MPILTGYIHTAMAQARYRKLPAGEFYAEIPRCKGVWASAATRAGCQKELQEVLEDWLVLKLRDGDAIPAVGKMQLKLAV